jgi:N-acyl-phosphatidylethanolamine-hydrolysing phospholipase D
MIKKKFSPQFMTVGLICLLSLAMQVKGETERSFAPAEQDSKGRYINLDRNLPGVSIKVTAPFFARRVLTAFKSRDGAPQRTVNDGVFLRENARHSEPTVTWVGHATLLVQMEHLTFLTDPIWSNRPSPVPFAGPNRYVKPGIAIEDLPPIDFVMISHNHYDHLDVPTLRKLAKRSPDTIFFVPVGNGKLLRKKGIEQVRELDWGETASIKGATIHCLPTQHWSKRSLTDTRKALWSSWAVTGPQRRFYFAGDTGYFEGFKEIGEKLGPFDLAAVPIGAYEPNAMMKVSHMNPEEAVQAAVDIKAERAVAMHFGTFNLSDEPLTEPPLRFKAAAENSSLGVDNSWVLDIGETRRF